MKTKNLLPLFALALSVIFTSCKKDDVVPAPPSPGEIEATFAMSSNQATADYLTEDAHDIMLRVTEEKNLDGNFTGTPEINNIVCALVTVTPQNGFPKTVIIDFGAAPGCTDSFGITRSGQIQVIITDSLRRPNATATMTFNNYYVNGFKKEGTLIWSNTSTPGTRSWRREVQNGKITAPNGNWWLHNGVKDVVQVHGMGTPHHHFDDAFNITGSGNTTNSAGVTRSHLIINALHKKVMCRWVDRGKIRFNGPNHFAVLDYGNGVCDPLATITIDGQVTHNIVLP